MVSSNLTDAERDTRQCDHGIIFLGTPHHGSILAKWGEALARPLRSAVKTNPNIASSSTVSHGLVFV
ncbi:hypothetical protein F5144DRAFT_560180 [Chaetomium tenue]|uniref:Uncharacterized protein n=1 Tax=Chaetomium tenue TaxID=1854479 RepID=A0ACB7PFN4_9PEZI|nr:hypothetical protein F5144DRAFT_560180 [Chaetomium globosum]